MSNMEEQKPEQESFEIHLTLNQLEVIASQMPAGYSLQFSQPLQKNLKLHQKSKQKKISKPKQQPKLTNEESQPPQPQLYQRQSLRKQQQSLSRYSDTQQKSVQAQPKNNQTLQQILKTCYKILALLKKHESAGPFLYPVNPIKLGIPDYFNIITNPMDLSTVDKKLRQGIYTNEKEFYLDMKLIWNNSYQYNMKGSDIWLMTKEMEASFEKLFAEKFSGQPESFAQLQQTVSQLQSKLHQMSNVKPENKKKSKSSKMKQDFNKLRPLTPEEKQQLGSKIRLLPSIYFEGILKIVKDQTQNQNQEDVVFDINKLPPKVARDLEKYVNDKLSKTKKNIVPLQQQLQPQPQQINYPQNFQQQQQFEKKQKIQNIPPQLMAQNSVEFQQKLMEERMQVHQQMMQLKQQQQQELLVNQSTNFICFQKQKQGMPMPQQILGIGQMPIQPFPMAPQQIQNMMPSQLQDHAGKSSSSSFLTDSEDDNI